MTDDIVTRLREQMQGCDNRNCEGCEVESDAVDEIERLQALVEHLSSQLRLQLKANDKAWEAYKEVVGDGVQP